ncbi:MAG: hypothetical protein ACJ763_08450, partial [Bdellovibrionia bacterium]
MAGNWTPSSFTLMRGGLLYRLERWLGLIRGESLSIVRRILFFWCLTWIPIVILEVTRFNGFRAANPDFSLYFDLRMNVRFLLAAPLMIASEIPIELRIARTLSAFEYREIVKPPGKLAAILSKANGWISGTPGIVVEAGIMIVIICITSLGLITQLMGPLREWKNLSPTADLPPPMMWYLWFALPLFQFIQLRWIWRFIVWCGVLWKLSRLKLDLFASHPDKVGGMAIITYAQEGFSLLWIA